MMSVDTLPHWPPDDELPHPGAVDEWVFAAWARDASLGVVSGHRIHGARAWYWSALVREGRPLLHLAEWDVRVRADPFVVKAPEMWAEHHCVVPLEQWSIGNEAYFVALDDADEAVGRGYGVPTPTAMDLEWYATSSPDAIELGFEQRGVVHGAIELAGEAPVELVEVPAVRWRRWSAPGAMPLVAVPAVVAHTGLRAPFAFPDGQLADWVLTRDGWCERRAGSGARGGA
jgi:hypothetical protein